MPPALEPIAAITDEAAPAEEQLASVVATTQVCAIAYDRLARELPPQLSWRSDRAAAELRKTLSACFEVATDARA